ncbi:MAG: hypothetical protein ACYTG0_17875, partial [Planctomycetota bacterium]
TNRATNAPYTVYDGTTAEGTIPVNQRLAPSTTYDNWPCEDLGIFNVDATTLRVELTDDANGYVMADAVRIERLGPSTISLAANYTDGAEEGFNDPTLGVQRRAAFEYALDFWADLLVPAYDGETITVDASMDPLGSEILGQAGSPYIHRDFGGGSLPGTWYGSPLANHLAGTDLRSGDAEIVAQFSSDADWYYGLDGNPGGLYDFVTVALHEVGHGLNFLDLINEDGSWFSGGYPGIYDGFLEIGDGTDLTAMTDAGRAAAIISGDLWWNGTEGVNGNGGTRPEVYAPDPYRMGSSTSHLDESTHGSELMSPFYSGPDHNPSGIELGMLVDMGWDLSSGASARSSGAQALAAETLGLPVERWGRIESPAAVTAEQPPGTETPGHAILWAWALAAAVDQVIEDSFADPTERDLDTVFFDLAQEQIKEHVANGPCS